MRAQAAHLEKNFYTMLGMNTLTTTREEQSNDFGNDLGVEKDFLCPPGCSAICLHHPTLLLFFGGGKGTLDASLGIEVGGGIFFRTQQQ